MPRDDSHVFVTGASGFVGANIMKYLAQHGRRALGTTRQKGGPEPLVRDYLGGLEDYVDWVVVDLTDHESVMKIAEEYKLNGVIHVAVFTSVLKEVEQQRARDILNSNFMGTVNTLELARKAGVKRFVYGSSSGVYGSTADLVTPVKEDDPSPYLRMSGFYGITKIASEKVTERYSYLFPMETASLRIAAPYGPVERPTSSRIVMGPIYRLLRLVLTEKRRFLRVKGLDYTRDWTHAMDTAKCLVAALDAPGPLSPVYNNTCGVNSSMKQILEAVQEVPGVSFEWEEVERDEDADFIASGGMRAPLSIEKASRELRFRPDYDLKRGIRDYCEWWQGVLRKGLRMEP